jgi:protocatechuate 3,4-dioxygenase beta subunit
MKTSVSFPKIVTGLARRRFLRNIGLGAAFFTTPGLFAEMLTLTPAQTEGPYYPDHLPLDTDNDLLVINDSTTPGLGEVTWLSGRVLDSKGSPVRNAVVEIWQCDANGVYLHTGDGRHDRRDKNFQSFGRFLTGSTGEYLFRTIKPVSYPGRTPHIHFKLKRGNRELLTTQCYIKGEPQNDGDDLYRKIGSDTLRAAVTVPFEAIPESNAGELAAKFDIVVGRTPAA